MIIVLEDSFFPPVVQSVSPRPYIIWEKKDCQSFMDSSNTMYMWYFNCFHYVIGFPISWSFFCSDKGSVCFTLTCSSSASLEVSLSGMCNSSISYQFASMWWCFRAFRSPFTVPRAHLLYTRRDPGTTNEMSFASKYEFLQENVVLVVNFFFSAKQRRVTTTAPRTTIIEVEQTEKKMLHCWMQW